MQAQTKAPELKLDVRTRDGLAHIGEDARSAEALGFDGMWNTEIASDPFPGLALAAEHTHRIEFGPSVAVALARSPMTVAYTAYELQRYSSGRLVLGLGSQIKAHIERRFDMPWSKPAARMKDYVSALRAIWTAWDGESALDYRGDFYSHDFMVPMNRPEPHPFGAPKVFLAAVGPLMLRTAGEVADGVFPHVFMTERYLREEVVPRVRAGQAAAGRSEDAVQIAASTFVASDERELEAARRQISFYASTLAYRPVLELHGWGELQTDLHGLSKQGRWDEMVPLVSDEVLAAMCVVGTPTEVAAGLRRRFGGVAQRLSFYVPGDVPPPSRYAGVIAALRTSPSEPARAAA